MTQNDKLLRGAYYVSVALFLIGAIMLIADNEFDIYTAWAMITYIVGVYLINKLK